MLSEQIFDAVGVYPKTSLSEDNNFETRYAYVEKMLEERSKTYDEEEKALRVIIMEEEGEREKKEKQERLEQKAMLNLSKGAGFIFCSAVRRSRGFDLFCRSRSWSLWQHLFLLETTVVHQ